LTVVATARGSARVRTEIPVRPIAAGSGASRVSQETGLSWAPCLPPSVSWNGTGRRTAPKTESFYRKSTTSGDAT